MEKSESIVNITKAICKVMQSVKGIDKTMTVGSGQNAYKAVSDKEVKQIIGEEMQKNGLSILPIKIDAKTTLTQWVDEWKKQKMQTFVEVCTSYLLMHESGEFIEIVGYGHGVDNQDKGAGKATTYALKNALLYSFLVPTGSIDDTDKTHSDDIVVPEKKIEPVGIIEMTKAVDEISNCKSTEQVNVVWAKYPNCQTKDSLFYKKCIEVQNIIKNAK